jgi:hypothetical protein
VTFDTVSTIINTEAEYGEASLAGRIDNPAKREGLYIYVRRRCKETQMSNARAPDLIGIFPNPQLSWRRGIIFDVVTEI